MHSSFLSVYKGTVAYSVQSQKSGSTNVTYFSVNQSNGVLTAKANTPAGTYTVVVRATAAGNSNYNSGYKDSTVTVTVGRRTLQPLHRKLQIKPIMARHRR